MRFLKKKKKSPSAEALLKKWDPTVKDRPYLDILLYNYRPEKDRYVRVKGIVLLYEKELVLYEDGKKLGAVPLDGAEEAVLYVSASNVQLALRKGETHTLIASADMKYKKRFGAFAQALSDYLEKGVYKKPEARSQGVCPKCGRPLKPGSDRCAHCGKGRKQWKWLWQMTKPLLPMLALSLFLFVSISLIGLISPMLSEKLVDGYLKSENPDASMLPGYLLVLGGMLLCTLSSRLLGMFRSFISAKMGAKAITRLRADVFDKVQKLSLEGIHKRTVGELMKRVSEDTNQIRMFLVMDLGQFVELAVTFAAIAVILLINDAGKNTHLFLFIFLPALPCALLFYLFHRRLHRIYNTQWKRESDADSLMHDIFSGIRVVKSFGKEKEEMARYDKAITSVKEMQKKNELFWSIFSPCLNFLLCTGEFFIIFFVGNKILDGSMTLGEMTKFSAYASMIYTPMRMMAFMPRRIYAAITSLNKIYDVIEDPNILPEAAEPEDVDLSGKVELHDVSFGYEEGKQVLRHIDLTIKPGEMVGIVGRSGVGKTTLVNLIMRLYDPNEGSITIDGHDVRNLAPACLRHTVGAVLQETFLFSGTVRDNIAYGKPEATGEEIIAAAKMAGAHDFIMKMQDGYDTQIGEKGGTLSGGERQRIAIARALLLDP